jgi:hypothetical protein
MGSLGIANDPSLGAFLNRVFPEGLDLGRCVIREALGVYVADPASTFRAGMLVMRNSAGLVVASDGTDVLGVAKWNHMNQMVASVVDEAVVLVGTTASNLAHANLALSGGMLVRSAAGGGTVYALTTDYVVNATNGTVTRNGGGTITTGQTVFISYMWNVAEADVLQLQGKNFWNSLDEVSMQENRCAVITDAELIFTTAFDPTSTYDLAANSNLYAGATTYAGLFTSDAAKADTDEIFVGKVFQAPTAADPFLGLRLVKNPVVRP